jgi:hypothetical protein
MCVVAVCCVHAVAVCSVIGKVKKSQRDIHTVLYSLVHYLAEYNIGYPYPYPTRYPSVPAGMDRVRVSKLGPGTRVNRIVR